jgi:pyruvate ferredoxin oxidoreductase delta subunit
MDLKKRDKYVHAHSKFCKGEAGKTGNWRTCRPEIDLSRCTPAKNKKPSCFVCWLYCPDAVVKRSIPVEIDLEYCKGCGICAEECPTKAIKMVEEKKE